MCTLDHLYSTALSDRMLKSRPALCSVGGASVGGASVGGGWVRWRARCTAASRPPSVLSIQSHVVYGAAGNSAAVFPIRRLGVNVMARNTVQFSNHTQYGEWEGLATPDEQISKLVDGIHARGGALFFAFFLTAPILPVCHIPFFPISQRVGGFFEFNF